MSVAATDASSARSKGGRVLLGFILLLLDVVAIVAVIMAVSDARLSPTAQAASVAIPTQLGAAAQTDPRVQRAEAALLAQLQAEGVPISTRSTVQAEALCIVVNAGGTNNDVAAQMMEQIAGLSDEQASRFVDAARATVCAAQG